MQEGGMHEWIEALESTGGVVLLEDSSELSGVVELLFESPLSDGVLNGFPSTKGFIARGEATWVVPVAFTPDPCCSFILII